MVTNASYSLTVDPNSSDRIYPDGTGDGKYLQSSTVGSYLELTKLDENGWIIVQKSGTWTAE